MNRPFRSLPAPAALLAALVLPCLGGSAARANELASGAHPAGFVVHDAGQTLRDYCVWEGATLYLQLPGGDRWELVTSIEDPAIANQGDGQFHAFDPAEVRNALANIRFPLEHVAAEIFLLPYPRRASLESAAGPGLILLSPGVRALPAELEHAEFTHELGHVVQYALMSDTSGARWQAYRAMRGIEDAGVFSAAAVHADRPHEIFAEDFRALYGDAQANYSGTIENPSLVYPTLVPGLTAFLSTLASAPLPVTPLLVLGDGHRGAVSFSRRLGGAAPLDLFDVGGRRIASVLPVSDGTGVHWSWDGRDAAGRDLHAGVLFARARDGAGGAVRLVRLP